jgi:hypothetical protein
MRLGDRVLPLLTALLACTLLAGCGVLGSESPPSAAGAAEPAAVAVPAPKGTRVVAVGDIACAPGSRVTAGACQQAATARLAEDLDPSLVLTLGDTQYPAASLADLRASYDKSWGRLLAGTRPTLGNHEYKTSGAKGYYSYFAKRQPGPPGYYRFNVGGWKVYVLNSNCTKVDCAKQAAWMERGMTAYPTKCTILTTHHPRYSSGPHGNNTAVRKLWAVAYKHRTDVVLSGHDHSYEWFTRMDGEGRTRSNGMQSFVVGTGGAETYKLGTRKPGSRFAVGGKHGVLALDLQPGRFDWAFRTIDGKVLDEGSRPCV